MQGFQLDYIRGSLSHLDNVIEASGLTGTRLNIPNVGDCMKKRTLLMAGAVLALMLVWSLPASAQVNWKKHSGTTLNAAFFSAAYIDLWFRPMHKRFTEETGIEIRMEASRAPQIRQKQDIMLSGKDTSLDLVMLQMDNRGGKLTAAGHLEDLGPYMKDSSKTPANHGFDTDWLGGCINTANVIKGQPVNNIVWSAQAQLLHIRKDLFKKYNVKVPETMAEMMAAAKALTIDENKDGEPEIYGFLGRGNGYETTAGFASYLWNMGGSWIEEKNGKRVANFNSKESIDAIMWWGEIQHNYAPASVLNNSPSGNAALYAAGKSAMLSELNFWHGLAEDPRKSRIVGKSTVVLVPSGPGGSYPNLPTTSLAVSKYSKKKDAAWTYIAWMTQKNIMQLGQNNSVPMCRRSVWTDPSYKADAGFASSARIAADYGIAIAKPQAIAITEIRTAVGEVIITAIKGGSRAEVQAEADKQAAIVDKLLAETEKGIDFAGVIRSGAKKMPASDQSAPIKAAGLEKLGM